MGRFVRLVDIPEGMAAFMALYGILKGGVIHD